jgi:type IV secretory pathway VirB4 component
MNPKSTPPAKLAKSSATSTQASLLISEIKDGVVIMRDGSLRAVVLVSAINFDLMSQQEQNSAEYAYQGFLNSLHFDIQIVIKSQKIDLDSYLEGLSKRLEDQTNPLLADLMEDYIANIKGLLDEVNIMDKQFFVVVPQFPVANVTKDNIISGLTKIFKPQGVVTIGQAEFEAAKTELSQRVQLVTSGLTQMGLRTIPLNTQELIDMYYTAYNPDVAANQKLIDASQLQTPVVTKGEGSATPPALTGGTQ